MLQLLFSKYSQGVWGQNAPIVRAGCALARRGETWGFARHALDFAVSVTGPRPLQSADLTTPGHFPFPSPPDTQARTAKDLPLPLSENLRGILLMCASMAAFTINDTFMKSVTTTLPLYQTIALRGLIAVVGLGLLVILTRAYRFRLNRRDGWLILLRSLADVAARLVIAPAELPIGIVTALLGAPFFLYLLLRERL